MEKHILILSDLVGCGNVAMATARAVLTRMGHRVYCLPTALISHTWNLGPSATLATTDYLRRTAELWQQLGFPLDGVLIGYLADEEQARWVKEQCHMWRQQGAVIFLDPVFADNGKLYRGITREQVALLGQLLEAADYVLPNLTEARFLTGEDDPLLALSALPCPGAVITGVPQAQGSAVLLRRGAERMVLPYDPVPGSFSGAGDAFSALFAGGILSGEQPRDAAQHAMDATKQWIQRSLEEGFGGVGLPVERYF